MTTKYTPGPWKYALAVANNAPNYYVIHAGRSSFGSTSIATANNEADARLMAAAPDLLAALQHIKDNLIPAAGAKHVREYIATFCADAITKATKE